jgi:hypothetical protein
MNRETEPGLYFPPLESLFLKCAHGASIFKRPNLQLSFCNTISSQGAPVRQVKLLQIENCKSQIEN